MSEDRSFAELRRKYSQEFARSGTAYVDKTFEPDVEKSMFSKGSAADVKWQTEVRNMVNMGVVQWRRARDLAAEYKLAPKLVVDGVSQFDINQGMVGNCWFLAGAAHLADRPDLFEQVVPRDQDFDANYGGVFHFYLWHYGQWKEVIVDDYIPCYRDQTYGWIPAYTRNYKEKNEFWAPLLEKAYAKMNGSYEAISGGFTRWSMVDLTGGLGYMIDYRRMPIQRENLIQTIETLLSKDTLLACAGVDRERSAKLGLEDRHAYTLLRIVHVRDIHDRQHVLVKVINPHGGDGAEWQGAWRDNDDASWSLLKPEDQGHLRRKERDGEFWMSYEDFTTHFGDIDVCLVPPLNSRLRSLFPKNKKPGWTIFTSPPTTWEPGKSAGGPPNQKKYWNNPHFRFTVESANEDRLQNGSSVFVALSRISPESNPSYEAQAVTLNFDLYAIFDDDKDGLERSDISPLGNRARQLKVVESSRRLYNGARDLISFSNLSPGKYCIIPWTNRPDQKEDFILRIAYEPGLLITLS